MRTLYCRHAGCGGSADIEAGAFPATCPDCKRDAKWSTTPGNIIVPRRKAPRVVWDLSLNDRRFLRSLHIDPEEPRDPTGLADDPA